MKSTLDDSVNSMVLSSVNDVFVLSFPFIVGEQVLVSDGIDVSMMRGFDRGMNKVGFVSFRVDRKGTDQFLGLI